MQENEQKTDLVKEAEELLAKKLQEEKVFVMSSLIARKRGLESKIREIEGLMGEIESADAERLSTIRGTSNY